MFENIKKLAEEIEAVKNKTNYCEELTSNDNAVLEYFNLRVAEAIMRDCGDSAAIAKIILMEKGMY